MSEKSQIFPEMKKKIKAYSFFTQISLQVNLPQSWESSKPLQELNLKSTPTEERYRLRLLQNAITGREENRTVIKMHWVHAANPGHMRYHR